MSEPTHGPERMWERGWEGHALAQRRRLAALPLAEKLAWLESAQALASFLLRGGPVTRSAGDEPR
jgi:hypothetical protein